MKVIVYNQDTGIPAVVIPTADALAQYGIEAIALKDVPAGKRFKIVDAVDLPSAPQETWTVDDADLTDGIGADYDAFPEVIDDQG